MSAKLSAVVGAILGEQVVNDGSLADDLDLSGGDFVRRMMGDLPVVLPVEVDVAMFRGEDALSVPAQHPFDEDKVLGARSQLQEQMETRAPAFRRLVRGERMEHGDQLEIAADLELCRNAGPIRLLFAGGEMQPQSLGIE